MSGSVEFLKRKEIIITPVDDGFFKIREFKIASDLEITPPLIIKELIKSRHFLWKETYKESVIAIVKGKEEIIDWNFHGLYRADKLSVKLFNENSFIQLKNNFFEGIHKNMADPLTIIDIIQELDRLNSSESTFYLLTLAKEEKEEYRHPWSIFDTYVSGLKINNSHKEIWLIEFGLEKKRTEIAQKNKIFGN